MAGKQQIHEVRPCIGYGDDTCDRPARARDRRRCSRCHSRYSRALAKAKGDQTGWAYSQERKDAARVYNLRTKYGITVEEYDAQLAAQGGTCAFPFCSRDSDLVVDHDHVTGRFRGILCRNCNVALGKLGDTTESLELVLAYLRHP